MTVIKANCQLPDLSAGARELDSPLPPGGGASQSQVHGESDAHKDAADLQ